MCELPGSHSLLHSHPPPPAYGAVLSPIQPILPSPTRRSLSSPTRSSHSFVNARFFSAFRIAFFIWGFVTLLTIRPMSWTFRGNFAQNNVTTTDFDFPIPAEYDVLECLQGPDWYDHGASSDRRHDTNNPAMAYQTISANRSYPYYSQRSYDLPTSSDLLFLLARGSLSSGIVKIVASPVVTDAVRVDIAVQYNYPAVLDHTKVCLMRRAEHEIGIGFFTPRTWHNARWEDRPYFTITVFIPEVAEDEWPLDIKAFETDMPNHAHVLDDLDGPVYFESLALKGSNGPIHGESVSFRSGRVVTSNGIIGLKAATFRTGAIVSSNGPVSITTLAADKAEIRTSNGPITGHYITSGDLVLKTSNAPVKVTVEFGAAADHATLDIVTSNNYINADISALSSSSSRVTARTSNGPLFAKIVNLPNIAALSLDARTSNNGAEVFLPAAYEGSYTLKTSRLIPQVKADGDIEDPMGRGRRRSVTTKMASRGVRAGNVYWDDQEKNKGTVSVQTSNGPITLHL
ncbi:hypothetical protein CPB85DRAFT_1328869 [Mucidula mucida]|nr:hypothetical protein CPB85DRAFT_1328869 [Mucidula mucida]